MCICSYLSQGSWACDHLGCYWLLSQQVWAVCVCVCLCVYASDRPEGVRVAKGDKNHGCTQSHIPSFWLLEPEPLFPCFASSCQYITARPQRHVPGGRLDCHVPQRSTLYELLLISCWSYWLSEFWLWFGVDKLAVKLGVWQLINLFNIAVQICTL